jgi:porphobilinogen synthase
VPEHAIMTDVALDPYNANGHDGIVRDGEIVNDETVEALVKMALAQAEAGADILGPSDMMDGRIGAMRTALEAAGHSNVTIMSYAAKYARPLRAVPRCGGRVRRAQGRQEDLPDGPGQPDEALAAWPATCRGRRHGDGQARPALSRYLPPVKDRFGAPTYAYQVSGEYAMIEAAAQNGWIDGEKVMMESLMSASSARAATGC